MGCAHLGSSLDTGWPTRRLVRKTSPGVFRPVVVPQRVHKAPRAFKGASRHQIVASLCNTTETPGSVCFSTWNISSIQSHVDDLVSFAATGLHVMCLQETRVSAEAQCSVAS
eukprot:2757466-Amphidinium_carterae.1